jgi:hypothetical protein
MAKVAPYDQAPNINVTTSRDSSGSQPGIEQKMSHEASHFSTKIHIPGEVHGHHDGRTSHVHAVEAGARGSIVHAAVNEWRYFMHWSGWYDSALATSMRRFLRGKWFAFITMGALFIALFFADLCILGQVPQNTMADIVLTFVFAIFLGEFLGLALTDASYLFSFFFWMDLLGTISMVFDISFMLGTDATKPEKYSGQRGEENLIVVRAARATKLGARAGRLSRVMKLLRFLPFVSNQQQDDDVKMAKVISNQLTNVLSTRVAFLTICIVVVLPIFGMFTYPEVDDSMSAWTQLLNQNAEEYYQVAYDTSPENVVLTNEARLRLQTELDRFANFYSSVSYGPFRVCLGNKLNDDGDFDCITYSKLQWTFHTTFEEPGRKGSIRDISEQSFQTSFDLSTPKQMEALANVGLICFIILVMTVFGLVTSSSISIIALQPLERMLSVVRQRCKQIFKYTDDLQEDDDEDNEEEEYDDTEQSSEFVLLEKVVAKLAAIAHLSTTKDEPEMREGMTEDEVMTLNWMQGTQAPVPTSKRSASMRNSRIPEGEVEQSGGVAELPAVSIRSQVTLPPDIVEGLETDTFDTLDLAKETKIAVAQYLAQTFEGCAAWVRSNVRDEQIAKFVINCESRYLPNPFHNFAHAVDVQYASARQMRLSEAANFLPEASMFWLMMSSVAHDLGHLGVNNQYLIETSHELALKYNDRSPLENMHCATMFQVVSDPEANIFSQVERDLYKEMRKGIINAILHTDVTKHNDMMKELALLYQMNSEAFDEMTMSQSVIEVLMNNTQLAINALLHGADVGNPMKPWAQAHRLAHLCVDEFFAQGDLEKAAGIPVQMLNDRDKVNRPNSQIGFIEFVIAPFAEAIVHLFPPLEGLCHHLGENVGNWFDAWVKDANPPPEAQAKMQNRIAKVQHRMEASMQLHRKNVSGHGPSQIHHD